MSMLTKRERQVLILAAQGYTKDRIAREIHMETSTVKRAIRQVSQRLGLPNGANTILVVVESVRRGWLLLAEIPRPERSDS